MLSKKVILLILLGLSLLCAPSIVWLVIGSNNLGDKCSNEVDSPDLATWLVVLGATDLFFLFLIVSIVLKFMYCANFMPCMVGIGIDSILLILLLLFNVAWCIVGAIRLSEAETCHTENPVLYNTALAAIILGFLSIASGFLPNPGLLSKYTVHK
jgi:hypothetical protein